MLDLYRRKSQVMPMQWVKLQPSAGMTEQWVRLVLEGGQLRIKLGYKSKFQDIKPILLSRFFFLLRCFCRSFALRNLKKKYSSNLLLEWDFTPHNQTCMRSTTKLMEMTQFSVFSHFLQKRYRLNPSCFLSQTTDNFCHAGCSVAGN